MNIPIPTDQEQAAHEARLVRAKAILDTAMAEHGNDPRAALVDLCQDNEYAALVLADQSHGIYSEALQAKAWQMAGSKEG